MSRVNSKGRNVFVKITAGILAMLMLASVCFTVIAYLVYMFNK